MGDRQVPERYAYAEEQEEELRKLLGDVSILRARRGGEGRPLPVEPAARTVGRAQ